MEPIKIDWDAFREWKAEFNLDAKKFGNLLLLLKFLQCKKSRALPEDYYDAIKEDSLGQSMLEKNGIRSVSDLIEMMQTNVNADYY